MGSRYNISLEVRKVNTRTLFLFAMAIIGLLWPLSGICGDHDVLKIDNNFLTKFLPDIKNTRLMIDEDVHRTHEREAYRAEGYAFVVTGDFNKDGITDYAVVGKYDGPDPSNSIFVAIFCKNNRKPTLEFLATVSNDRAFLMVESGKHLTINNISKKFDVIIVALALGSDNGFAVAWDGKKFVKTNFDYIDNGQGNGTGITK